MLIRAYRISDLSGSMSKIQLVLLISLASSLNWPSCLAVPSLLCIPKTPADPIQISINRKQDQAAIRRIRVYYVNGHSEWEAKALVINDQVKAIIFKTNQRPVIRSIIDSSGFGSGVDFRGLPWEFHGFLDPWLEISTTGKTQNDLNIYQQERIPQEQACRKLLGDSLYRTRFKQWYHLLTNLLTAMARELLINFFHQAKINTILINMKQSKKY